MYDTEDILHICSICRSQIPVLLCNSIAYHRVGNKSITTVSVSRAGTVYTSASLEFTVSVRVTQSFDICVQCFVGHSLAFCPISIDHCIASHFRFMDFDYSSGILKLIIKVYDIHHDYLFGISIQLWMSRDISIHYFIVLATFCVAQNN